LSLESKITQFEISEIIPQYLAEDLTLQIGVRFSVANGSSAEKDVPPQLIEPSPEELLELAGAIYDARRKRDKILVGEYFREPAWDMLLALYCLPPRGESLSITSLSYAANVPPTTGHRVQATLGNQGLIQRTSVPSDGRRQIVSLTQKGRTLLEQYLSTLIAPNQKLSGFLGVATI